MRLLSRLKSIYSQKKNGFTLIEMVVVAPILLLIIGTFISATVNMTGSVLSTDSSNNLTYNIQNAMDRIEQDVKLSSAFLATTDTGTPTSPNTVTLSAPQFYDDDTATVPFNNVDATYGNMLILNTYTTTNNPTSLSRNIIYKKQSTIACNSPQVIHNPPLMMNVIYFVKNKNNTNTLWRRVVANSTYTDDGCAVPWQQPSCATGKTGDLCKTEDTKLIDNITQFSIKYYPNADSDTENTVATTASNSDSDRQAALNVNKSIGVEIHASTNVAARTVNRVGTMRITRQNNNASLPAIITQQPISRTTVGPNGTTFTASSSISSPSIYWLKSTDNGVAWTVEPGATLNTLTIASTDGGTDQTKYRAVFSDGKNTVVSSPATLTSSDPGWIPLSMPAWTNYNTTYNSAEYRKTTSGVVVLKGLIKKGIAPVANEIIGTLPVGYRPSQRLIFTESTYSSSDGSTSARVDIDTNGNIIYMTGSNLWLSLENIHFIPTYGRYTYADFSGLSNGWTNYGGVYGNASYAIDNLDRIHVQGLVVPGTITDNTVIFNLPTSLVPSRYQHVASIAGNGFSLFGVSTTAASIVAKGSGTGWLSLNTMYYTGTSGWSDYAGGLLNGWVNLDANTYTSAQYRKGSDGIVTLKGMIANGTANTIAQLPAGYRPKNRMICTTASWGVYSRIDIDATSGNIVVVAGGNSLWRSLDNISFYADQ